VSEKVTAMTASPLPRRRVNRQSRKQVIGLLIGLALVWLTTLSLRLFGKMPIATPPKYISQIRRLQSLNPEDDAVRDFHNGNYRLFVLEVARQKVPGVPNSNERVQQLGVRVIPLPFATATDKSQERLQHAAFEYAFKYNVAILKLIEKEGLSATAPSTLPAALQPATQPNLRKAPLPTTQP
jgi:hypothetical protein